MKKYPYFFIFLILICCGSNRETTEQIELTDTNNAIKYAETITPKELKEHLYIIASDEFEGRKIGEAGQKKAAEYLKSYYLNNGISSPPEIDNYTQNIPTEDLKIGIKPSENIVAFIEGSEKKEEIVVISAHYDHLGMTDEDIYNGADDNGSGTVALLEIAEAFQNAVKNGNGPKRSLLFLHLTGEEKGLLGSKYYVNHPIFPLKNTIVNLNIDMIGRVDDAHVNFPYYIYLIGSDKLSKELHILSEKTNSTFTQLKLDYTFNDDKDPNRFYYRSDHYSFAKNNIPVIFYFNGSHQDYHKPSDTPDKINYKVLAKRTQLVFFTAWELANRAEKIKVDVLN